MAKKALRIKNLRQVKHRIETDIQKAIYDDATARNITRLVVNDIRKGRKFTPKKATIAIRKYLEKFNRTHPDYQRSKINFTFTGELLNDLIKNVKKFKFGKRTVYNIEHSNTQHKKYNGVKSKETPTHQDIYRYLGKISPRYQYLRRKFKKKTARKIVKLIKRRIIQYYTRK